MTLWVQIVSGVAVVSTVLLLGAKALNRPNNRAPATYTFPAEERAFSNAFPKDAKFWLPSDLDLSRAEDLTAALFKEKHGDIYNKLSTYARQYVGVQWEGRRIVFINFMCKYREENLNQVLTVRDGGDCYLQIKVDLNSGECFDLKINGES